jgi:hypothetical protein
MEQITVRRDDMRLVPTVETVGYYANRPDGTDYSNEIKGAK